MQDINMVKSHKFIVVGEEHYNPLGVIRSLGEKKIKPIAIILKTQNKYQARVASLSKYISKLIIVDTYNDVPDILLSQYSNENVKPFVIACDDICVGIIDAKYDELKKYFYIENCGKQGNIDYYNKKIILNEVAKRHGMKVARTWALDNGIPDDIIFPVITKPFESYDGWKQDYYICKNEEDLKVALEKVKGKVFLQQYIKKVNELDINGIAINHGTDVFISIAVTYTYLLPDYYSMEMIVKNFDDLELEKKVNGVLKETEYEGIFCMEFLIDEHGDYWFLEINFRNSTWSWASTRLGMNLPYLWAESTISGSISRGVYKKIPDNYMALAEIPDFEQRVRKRKMLSFRQWLLKVKKADCLYFYDKDDMKPYFSVWCKKITNLLIKSIN